jgi:hypothetical protein
VTTNQEIPLDPQFAGHELPLAELELDGQGSE